MTGGSRGIGRAIVLRLARQGADVAFSYRGNQPAADATVAEVEALGRALPRDPGGRHATPRPPRRSSSRSSRPSASIDILVNNAGITRDDLIMRMSLDDWRDVLETNLFGAFYALKAVTRPMLKAKGGRVINITSGVGPGGPDGPGELQLRQGGADRADQGGRPRARLARHHRQRRRARASCSRS